MSLNQRGMYYSNEGGINHLYYVVESTQLWCYHSNTYGESSGSELDSITSLHYNQNHLYIDDVCYLDTGDSLLRDDQFIGQKGISYLGCIVTHDDINKTVNFKDSTGIIHHVDDNILKVFVEDEILYYIKKPATLRLPKV